MQKKRYKLMDIKSFKKTKIDFVGMIDIMQQP